MGFIHALYDLGLMIKRTTQDTLGENNISCYLQLPIPVVADIKRSGREIRIWLSVEDKNTDVLDVLAVSKIDLVEYPRTDKEKYLYHEPVSPAAAWRFSPIYKLGKGMSDGRKELIGRGDEGARHEMMEWLRGLRSALSSNKVKKEIKDNRYFKLKNAMLDAYEKESVFSSGAIHTIMQYLIGHIDDLAELWSDTNRSYILIFGIDDNGRFLYPGEVPAFRRYFEKKLSAHMAIDKVTKKDKVFSCAVCGNSDSTAITIDKLFAFATFDKASFLPGAKNILGAKEKVYPVCQRCFSCICNGKEKVKESFRDTQTIQGLNIDIIPELLFGTASLYKVAGQTEEFLHKGIKMEEKRFNRLAEQGDGLVYHFFFWEQNQRQERVHRIIEDVPPSRLRKVLKLWKETNKTHLPSYADDADKASLDSLFRLLYRVLMDLAGKRDEDKKNMRDRWMDMTSRLLGGEHVDVYWLKTLMVSRFPGLFADNDWIKRFGQYETKNMIALVDFFERANAR